MKPIIYRCLGTDQGLESDMNHSLLLNIRQLYDRRHGGNSHLQLFVKRRN